MKLRIIVLVSVCVANAAILAFALYVRAMAGVVLYDANFEVFHSLLTPQQRHAIVSSARDLMNLLILLLIITNMLWLGFVAYSWHQRRGATGDRCLNI